ncbi:c-type cytochrome biogenesis protein CcmI [Cohaesibacter intestini]|uniref:c-type cytochrome biogenesis protein CcmI n=1 Tax=Cohaesibacter intestini TaxID=2211145 RepID=UPI001300B24E|nr:c-type cytochrome biogenesis protein CcmI [Cohaesibacter intestini]
MFWTFAAILTFAAVASVIYPLTRKSRRLQSADAYDLTVYKSQLKEIDGDVERGLIASDEADAARAEVARRLLIAQESLEKSEQTSSKRASRKKAVQEKPATPSTTAKIVGIAAVMIVPFISMGLYVVLGSPTLQSQPLAARLQKPPEKQSLTELVASAEKKLKQNPDDLQGWKKLAPIYLSMRRPNEAVKAYHNVLRLEGETAETLTDLGEALVVREAGIVSDQAFDLFKRANQLDARSPKPRFFLAIALGQKGQEQDAIKTWDALIKDSKPSAPWVSFAKSQIAALQKRLNSDVAGQKTTTPPHGAMAQKESTLSGPSAEDVNAASEMTTEDRQQMIENMVSQLAERLNEEGGSADEWVRLIRAELVLNRPDEAAKTVAKAMESLQSDVEGLEKVKAAARSLGVSVNQ